MTGAAEVLGLSSCTSASRTDEKDGDRRDDKGCAEEEVKLRRQPAAIKQRAASAAHAATPHPLRRLGHGAMRFIGVYPFRRFDIKN
jgi:hypothetical protein